jgi:hypothetical protein
MTLDDICPLYVGAGARIVLVPETTEPPRAFQPFEVSVALALEAVASGVRLPLEMTITAPTPGNFVRHIYRYLVPTRITFTPREGGPHLVRLREVGHNRWWGALAINVAGEPAKDEDAA